MAHRTLGALVLVRGFSALALSPEATGPLSYHGDLAVGPPDWEAPCFSKQARGGRGDAPGIPW